MGDSQRSVQEPGAGEGFQSWGRLPEPGLGLGAGVEDLWSAHGLAGSWGRLPEPGLGLGAGVEDVWSAHGSNPQGFGIFPF